MKWITAMSQEVLEGEKYYFINYLHCTWSSTVLFGCGIKLFVNELQLVLWQPPKYSKRSIVGMLIEER